MVIGKAERTPVRAMRRDQPLLQCALMAAPPARRGSPTSHSSSAAIIG